MTPRRLAAVALPLLASLSFGSSARADETPRYVPIYSTNDKPATIERFAPAPGAKDDDDDGKWVPLCTTPCMALGGLKLRATGDFPGPEDLDMGPRVTRVDITPGSRERRITGIVLIPVGGVVTFASLLLAANAQNSEGVSTSKGNAALAGMLIGGAISIIGGILLATSGTRAKEIEGN